MRPSMMSQQQTQQQSQQQSQQNHPPSGPAADTAWPPPPPVHHRVLCCCSDDQGALCASEMPAAPQLHRLCSPRQLCRSASVVPAALEGAWVCSLTQRRPPLPLPPLAAPSATATMSGDSPGSATQRRTCNHRSGRASLPHPQPEMDYSQRRRHKPRHDRVRAPLSPETHSQASA
jgi:hypothetical protein